MIRSIRALALAAMLAVTLAVPASAQHGHERGDTTTTVAGTVIMVAGAAVP
jgi:hypothetical protein